MNMNNTSVKLVTIAADEAGQRIDNFLRNQLKGVPKSMIYRIVRKGEVRVNKNASSQNINYSRATKFEFHRCELPNETRLPCRRSWTK